MGDRTRNNEVTVMPTIQANKEKRNRHSPGYPPLAWTVCPCRGCRAMREAEGLDHSKQQGETRDEH